MRDTSVSDEDLAIQSAKQKLVTLKDRPGYADAMRKAPSNNVARVVCLTAAAACGGIVYACTLYITAAWLMWFFIIVFGLIGVGCLFAIIGLSSSALPVGWAVAVLERQLADDKRKIVFLRDTGERVVADVSEQMYELLRPGDLGVLAVTGESPNITVDSFKRL